MKVSDVVRELKLEVLCDGGGPHGDREISGCYVSDLLSDVIANGKQGGIWVTIQTHVNIVSVAALRDIAAVVLANGRRPPAEVVEKAEDEHVTLLASGESSFATAGRLYALGIR